MPRGLVLSLVPNHPLTNLLSKLSIVLGYYPLGGPKSATGSHSYAPALLYSPDGICFPVAVRLTSAPFTLLPCRGLIFSCASGGRLPSTVRDALLQGKVLTDS